MTTQTLKVPTALSGIAIQQPGRPFNPGPFSSTVTYNCGRVKSGKTSTAASFSNSLILDFEGKIRMVPELKSPTLCPTTFQESEDIFNWLVEVGIKKAWPARYIIIDTIDEYLYSLVIPGLTAQVNRGKDPLKQIDDIRNYGSGGKGSKGWDMVTSLILGHLRQLKLAGYGLWINAHIKEASDTASARPAPNPGLNGGLFRMCEFYTVTAMTSVETTVEVPAKVHPKTGKVIRPAGTQSKHIPGCVLQVASKPADSDLATGGNLTLPSPIILELGKAADNIIAAYDAAVKERQVAQETPNGATDAS